MSQEAMFDGLSDAEVDAVRRVGLRRILDAVAAAAQYVPKGAEVTDKAYQENAVVRTEAELVEAVVGELGLDNSVSAPIRPR